MGVNGMLLVFFGTVALLTVIGVRTWVRGEKRDEVARADETARADEVLAALFDGSPAVTYVPVDSSGGFPTEVLVKAATDRGYRYVSETGQGMTRRVVFERS